jgi:hypothetical protein
MLGHASVFTPLNITRMRDMAENGSSSFEIAQAIGSTAASVRVRCSHYKIRIKCNPRTQHTPSRLVRNIVAQMPASLHVGFQRKAEQLWNEAFCARMRKAIAAGLESAPIGVVTTPGTKNPKYIPAEPLR